MSSSPTQLPLFLRKYNVDVLVPQADGSNKVLTVASDQFEVPLKVTFDIYQPAFQSYWCAEIVIYNLDQQTTQEFLSVGMQNLQVVVSAGYKQGSYGVIWSGPVFQPLFDRENVTDFKITLNCILGLWANTRNSINLTVAANLRQTDVVMAIANSAFSKIPVVALSSNISDKKLPRGKTMFGNPGTYFSQIATDNGLTWWLSQKGLTMKGLNDPDIPTTPSLTYSPPVTSNQQSGAQSSSTNGVIIGTPQQTQYGVSFRVLLDPRLQVFSVVKIDNSQIRLIKKQVGELPYLLDQDGIYVVGAVRFTGDTRGNDWYADIDGYTTVLAKQSYLARIANAS